MLERKVSEVAQSCQTLCDPMDYNIPGSSIRGISQARGLEWVAISFSRGYSRPRDQTRVFCIASRLFTIWATRNSKRACCLPIGNQIPVSRMTGRNTQHYTNKDAKSFQSCPTLCNPLDCSAPGSSVHGILQARILERVTMPFSRGIFPIWGSNPHHLFSCIGRQVLYH